MQIGIAGSLRQIGTALLLILAPIHGCNPKAAVYGDLNTGTDSFGEVIDTAPVVVIAETGEKLRIGRPGVEARSGDPKRPKVQKYRVALKVRRVLRGDSVHPNTRITFSGYESEGSVAIGPPQGVSAKQGELAIYFLRPNGAEYRTMVDVYRYWIRLDRAVDVDIARGADLPEDIWRLLVYPFTAGLRPGTSIDFGYITQATGYRMGRARVIGLMKAIAADTKNRDLQIEACLTLNETHRGCGGETCLSRLLAQGAPTIAEQKRTRLCEALNKVPRSNQLVRDALLDGSEGAIGRWAYSHDPVEIGRFLTLLRDHPDKEIAILAERTLRRTVRTSH